LKYTLDHIAEIIGAQSTNRNGTIEYLLTDSRKVFAPSQTLFFALKGPRRNGHQFIAELYKKGVNLKPVTIDGPGGFVRLLDMPNAPSITDENFPGGWVNFYRVDDYASVSYFYLDKAASSLPSLPSVESRIQNVK